MGWALPQFWGPKHGPKIRFLRQKASQVGVIISQMEKGSMGQVFSNQEKMLMRLPAIVILVPHTASLLMCQPCEVVQTTNTPIILALSLFCYINKSLQAWKCISPPSSLQWKQLGGEVPSEMLATSLFLLWAQLSLIQPLFSVSQGHPAYLFHNRKDSTCPWGHDLATVPQTQGKVTQMLVQFCTS